MKLTSALTAAAALLGTWAAVENTSLLRVQRYAVDIPNLPRIVQLSDLHKRRFGKNDARLIRAVAALKPEYIVITGDLLSRTETNFARYEALLRCLRACAPVLAVMGNHELDFTPAQTMAFRDVAARCDITLLDNTVLTAGGITFAGLSLTPAHYRGGGLLGYRGARTCHADDLLSLFGECQPNTVLLAHNPLFFPAYAAWGAKLTLSGHVHGGAVRLPILGGLLSPERKFFPRYDKGMYRIGSAQMIVSGGLGKLRLFNPPEICLICANKPEK